MTSFLSSYDGIVEVKVQASKCCNSNHNRNWQCLPAEVQTWNQRMSGGNKRPTSGLGVFFLKRKNNLKCKSKQSKANGWSRLKGGEGVWIPDSFVSFHLFFSCLPNIHVISISCHGRLIRPESPLRSTTNCKMRFKAMVNTSLDGYIQLNWNLNGMMILSTKYNLGARIKIELLKEMGIALAEPRYMWEMN